MCCLLQKKKVQKILTFGFMLFAKMVSAKKIAEKTYLLPLPIPLMFQHSMGRILALVCLEIVTLEIIRNICSSVPRTAIPESNWSTFVCLCRNGLQSQGPR